MHDIALPPVPALTEKGSAKSNAHPIYRPDIDGLRALAVLSVVIFHAFPTLLPGGFVGVDIFFVISGYLISNIIFRTLKRGDFNFLDFYAHRIRRIFPALILVLASSYVLGWFALLPSEARQLGKHIVSGAGFVLNMTLSEESGYFDTASELKPLMHLWSLAIEEQFYLVYPLLIWCAWKLGWNLLGVVAALALTSFALNVVWIEVDILQAYFSPLTRFWELLAGAVLAHIQTFGRNETTESKLRALPWLSLKNPFPSCSRQARSDLLSICALLLILASVTVIHKDRPFPGWWATVPVSGAVLSILAGPNAWMNRKLLANKLLVGIGLISYPLYLWHWPLLSFARMMETKSFSPEVRVLTVAVSFLLAWLTYHLIEHPVRSQAKSRKWTGMLCGLLTFVGCVGYASYQGADLAIRRPTHEIAEIIALNGRESFPFVPYSTQRECKQEGFQSICTQPQRDHTIFLWGDSHASSLYPGFDTLQKNYPSVGISQSTGCGNPPFIRLGNYTDTAWCNSPTQRLNQNLAAIRMISGTKPSIVVLHARWAYEHYHTSQSESIRKLKETIEAIQSASLDTKIIVLGPVPNWKTTLAREMFVHWRKSFPSAMPPQYINSGLVDEIAEWDKFLESEVPRLGVNYLSAYKVLCRQEGCLTRVGPKSSDLTAVDYGHLSPAGSIYLVNQIGPSLLELMGVVPAAQPAR